MDAKEKLRKLLAASSAKGAELRTLLKSEGVDAVAPPVVKSKEEDPFLHETETEEENALRLVRERLAKLGLIKRGNDDTLD